MFWWCKCIYNDKYYHNKNIKDEIQIFSYNSFLLNYL